MSLDADRTPFANRAGKFLVFRVNRRPMFPDHSILPRAVPDGVFDHFRRVLAPGYEVVTTRGGSQRSWRIGQILVDTEGQTIVGKIGWATQGRDIGIGVPQWSEEEADWVTGLVPSKNGGVLPFGFESHARLLLVLAPKGLSPGRLAEVFERVLRENEAELPGEEQTTEWSVEPVLDHQTFRAWLERVDVLERVTFKARLPNPEPRAATEDLVARMERRGATEFTETMKSSRPGGLVDIENDPDFSQAMEMGQDSFATISGKGVTDGRPDTYSQSDEVANEIVEDLPPSWGQVWPLVKSLLVVTARRFRERYEHDAS